MKRNKRVRLGVEAILREVQERLREQGIEASLGAAESCCDAGEGARVKVVCMPPGLAGSVLGPMFQGLWKTVWPQRLTLDGPLALWQPAAIEGSADAPLGARAAPAGE